MIKDYFLNPEDYTAEEILREDKKYTIPTGIPQKGIVFVSGKGSVLEDINGKKYLDFMAAHGNVAVGYSNQTIIETMQKQLNQLTHHNKSATNITKVKLAKLVVELFPEKAQMAKMFTAGGGSEANEGMLKLSRKYTADKNATKFISWWESYHGQTMGALSASGQPSSKPSYLDPLTPDFTHIPMPNCYNCSFGKTYPKCNIQCAKFVEDLVHMEGSRRFSGMLFEPIISAAGGMVPPKEYFEIIKDLCDKEKICLMFDEIITGFGRTGKMFACEHYGIYPMMTSLAKCFTSGYVTASAMVVNKEIADMGGFEGSFHSFTGADNVLSSAVAYANVNYIIDNELVEGAEKKGAYLNEKLNSMASAFPDYIGEIRGKGLLKSIVFKKDVPKKSVELIIDHSLKMGLFLYGNFRHKDIFIWLCPPLIITNDEIDFAVDTISKSIEKVSQL